MVLLLVKSGCVDRRRIAAGKSSGDGDG